MKAKPAIFKGLALIALGCATAGSLRADQMRQLAIWKDTGSSSSYISSTGGMGATGSNLSGEQSGAGQSFSPSANQPPPPVDKAMNLSGMKVKNQNNQTLGKIKDIVFDVQSGRVSYVVMKKAGRTHGTGAYVAVPLSAFTPSADMKHLILNADKKQLQTSQGFSRNNYPALGNPSYGAQPAIERQEILIVPMPASPDQNQDQRQLPDQSPKSDRDQSNP